MRLRQRIESLDLTIDATFVPWSQSRSFVPGNVKTRDKNLNWKISVKHGGREVLTTEYSAGIGHAPSYKALRFGEPLSIDTRAALEFEVEHGRVRKARRVGSTRIEPDPVDVIWALVQDSDVIQYPTFEAWAESLGFDTDSRKAEAAYRSCLTTALALHAAIGSAGLDALREAGEDY